MTIVKTEVYVQFSEEVAKEQKEERETERVGELIMKEDITGGPIHLTCTSSKPFPIPRNKQRKHSETILGIDTCQGFIHNRHNKEVGVSAPQQAQRSLTHITKNILARGSLRPGTITCGA